MTIRVTQNADGDFVEEDVNGVQPSAVDTKEAYEARGGKNQNLGGIQINPHKHTERIQMGSEAAEDQRAEDAQMKANALNEELNVAQARIDAGVGLASGTTKRWQGLLSDLSMAYVSFDGDVNDEALVDLRQRISALSYAVNKR